MESWISDLLCGTFLKHLTQNFDFKMENRENPCCSLLLLHTYWAQNNGLGSGEFLMSA